MFYFSYNTLALLDVDGDGSISRSEFDEAMAMEGIDEAIEGGLFNWMAGCDWGDDACYDDIIKNCNENTGISKEKNTFCEGSVF